MAEVGVTAAGGPNDGRVGYGSVLGLRIPADTESPLALAVLRLTASQLSDAIGGGLLEDALIGDAGRSGYPFYLDEHRVAKGLLPHVRALSGADWRTAQRYLHSAVLPMGATSGGPGGGRR